MADASILDPSVAAAPKEYTISGSQELLIKSITASFDGSAAAVPWVPAIQLLDSANEVIGTYPMDASVAAGASADVSFFPSLKRGSGGSGGGGITATTEQFNQSAVSTSIANSFSTVMLPTNHLAGPVLFTPSAGQMRAVAAGVYAVNINVQLTSAAWTAGGGFELTVVPTSYNQVSNVWVTFPTVTADPHFPQAIQANVNMPPLHFNAGEGWLAVVLNLDGVAARNFFIQSCSMIQYT